MANTFALNMPFLQTATQNGERSSGREYVKRNDGPH